MLSIISFLVSRIFFTFFVFGIFVTKVSSEITTFINFTHSPSQNGWNENNTTIFYVHDWNTRNLDKAILIKANLLKYRKDVSTVIIADWSSYSKSPDYYNVAKKFTPRVAEDVESQMKAHVDSKMVDSRHLECIGHGVGAHVCGQAGKLWNQRYGSLVGKIGKITGLNPTGPYFKDHLSESLAKGDAVTVEVVHTDTRFGIYTNIGDRDIYPINETDSTTETCKKQRLKRNKCLHNAVIDIFLRNLETKSNTSSIQSENSTVEKIPMVILTLDVSPSMQSNGRIQSMVAAAKRFVYSLPIGYYIGIVIFGGNAIVTLPPTNITQNSTSTDFIISKLPTTSTEIANTSIGAGISKALNLAEPFLASGEYCPDIILVTDGEENRAPSIRDVEPLLNNLCTKVHTIALGDEADVGLESLSVATGGQTYFASDVNSLDKLTQSLVASSTVQFKRNMMPVLLPSKTVMIDAPVSASFQIDEGINKNTSFLVSMDNPEEVKAELIAPNGQMFGVNHYTVDTDLHQLLFKLLEVQPGNWTIKLDSGEINPEQRTRRKRSSDQILNRRNQTATIFVTSYQSDAENEPIRLEAYLSGRVLNYGKEIPLTITAHLFKGEDGIIGAKVQAEIFTSDGSIVFLDLLDNGAGADEEENDGVYTRYITGKLIPGKRYQVEVQATSAQDESTKVRSGNGDPFQINDDELSLLGYNFERQATAGSFRVDLETQYKSLPPNSVKDLKVITLEESTRRLTLAWTAAGKEADSGIADSIELRGFTGRMNESDGFKFSERHIVDGSIEPLLSGSTQQVTLEIPERLWEAAKNSTTAVLDLYFTVRSENILAGFSETSNLAPAEFAVLINDAFSINSTYLAIIISAVVILLVLVAIAIFIYMRNRMDYFKVQSLT